MPIIPSKEPIKIGDTTFYSVVALSKKLGVSLTTLRGFIKSGKLKGKKIGGTWLVTETNLKKFLGNGEENNKLDDVQKGK